jgi:acyl carrier protein
MQTDEGMGNYDRVLATLREELIAFTGARAEIGEDTDLLADLKLDSLQLMNLLPEIEDRFDVSIPVNVLPDVRTVRDLARQIEHLLGGR